MVKKVAGLLAAAHVGFEDQAALGEADRRIVEVPGDHVTVGQAKGLPGSHVSGQPQHHRAGPGCGEQGVHQHRQVWEPHRRVQLDHQRVGVPVDHKPGHGVVFAVDQPVGGSSPGLCGDERCPTGGGRHHPLGPEVLIDLDGPADVEDPDRNGGVGVVQPNGRKLALVIEDDGQVARRALVVDRGHRTLVHPGVPPPNLA